MTERKINFVKTSNHASDYDVYVDGAKIGRMSYWNHKVSNPRPGLDHGAFFQKEGDKPIYFDSCLCFKDAKKWIIRMVGRE